MKILVTGTAGFIGFYLAQKLLDLGHDVVGLDSINDYYDVNLKYNRLEETGISRTSIHYDNLVQSQTYERYKFIQLNLEDKESMMNLFQQEKFDAVCNLAAQAGVRYSIENPDAYISSNIVGFMNILEACRHNNIKNLSYASSSSVYGLNESQPFKTSDKTDSPISLYAATKKSNELMAHTYSHLYGLQTTGLRFFTVYGPWGRPDMAPMIFADKITNGKQMDVFNNGEMSRDFTYIDDIVDGVVGVIMKPAEINKVYNIGNSSPVNLLEFINIMETEFGQTTHKNMMPMQDGDVVSTYADTSALKEDFGYSPNTPLTEGVHRFAEWYKTYKDKL